MRILISKMKNNRKIQKNKPVKKIMIVLLMLGNNPYSLLLSTRSTL